MDGPEPKDRDILIDNLRRHIEQHRELAEERETRIIELDREVARLQEEKEALEAAGAAERIEPAAMANVESKLRHARQDLRRLNARRSVRLALRLADSARPVLRALKIARPGTGQEGQG